MGKAERERKKASRVRKRPSQGQDQQRVKILDAHTGIVGTIPGRELAAGVAMYEIDGRGQNWMNVNDVQQGVIQHPPFDEATHAQIRTIQEAFADVYPLSVEQWADGFRRDRNPRSEIAIWLYMAVVYGHLSEHRSSAQKLEIFSILLQCSNGTPRQHVLTVAEIGALSRLEGETVMASFYQNAPEGAVKPMKAIVIGVGQDNADDPP